MKKWSSAILFLLAALGGILPVSGGIVYTCDPSVSVATCNYLNTTIAAMYSSTFTNANANIYITYGTTGLAQTQSAFNVVSYSSYLAALTANTNKSTIQTAALAALNAKDSGPYGGGNVNITAALASALGLTGLTDNGVPAGSASPCSLLTAGCYNAEITVTNNPGTPLYYDNLGGTEPSDAYDFYATVEHETDEVLGTASCIDTGGASLADGCDFFGNGTPSAVDLFRYQALNSLILDSSLSTTPGAYFSYNGGLTNGANGFVYNTLSNGNDYADFLNNCPGGPLSVQDAEGCPGVDAGLSILNDGKGEINILNAVGFDLVSSAVPEPATIGLLGVSLAMLAFARKRRA